jgi:branched-chain amino acid transport system substrate-binding protein
LKASEFIIHQFEKEEEEKMKYQKGIFSFVMVFVFVVSLSAAARAEEIVLGFSGPLSGPAAEYGQDCVNGIDMAVKDVNAAGGITVKGKKYTFKLQRLDDSNDPTKAVNNARRFRADKAVAIYNGVFSTIAALAKINEEKGNEFLLMAYTSTPKVMHLNNKLLIGTTAPPFTVYVQSFCETAWAQGWRKIAMVATLGAYGDEWRTTFKNYWQKIGGTITVDKPANYYTETDFSASLAAALATKPDALLIGGPSATTALVIEQSRGMGFKGGFILIDQAKMDTIEEILGSVKLMDNTIGVAGALTVNVPVTADFGKRYKAAYKRSAVSESLRHYGATIMLAKAIPIAGTVDDAWAIRAAIAKALPIVGDRIPTEFFGINDNGRIQMNGSVTMIKNGKIQPPNQYFWWPKNQAEWDRIKKLSKSTANMVWFKPKIDDVF